MKVGSPESSDEHDYDDEDQTNLFRRQNSVRRFSNWVSVCMITGAYHRGGWAG